YGSEHEWNVPWKAFKTQDGYVVFTTSSEGTWRKLCQAIGHPDLAEDDRFRTGELRARNRDELYAILDPIIAERMTAQWLRLADAAGAAAAPVNTIDQVFKDPQVLHRQMLQYVDHPTLGRLAQIGHPQKFSGTPASIRLAPPLLGQHTDETLQLLLGFSPSQIAELRAQKVI
ncbi:MAG: Formyl-CoA transferase, partial [Firmicutes bacterium]|nr:Formyl-CoA transferase [Bacillota bacterium]